MEDKRNFCDGFMKKKVNPELCKKRRTVYLIKLKGGDRNPYQPKEIFKLIESEL